MRRDNIDFFIVEPHHLAIHERLCNWARYVAVRFTPAQHPMWRQGRSNARQWHAPVLTDPVDSLDAQAVEKAISALPVAQRDSLRWFYVFGTHPERVCRKLGLSRAGLLQAVRDGRQMLMNRTR